VVSVAVAAAGDVPAGPDGGLSVRLVLLRLLVVAGPAALAADRESLLGLMRNGAPVDVAIEALETFVRRVGEVVGKGRPMGARLVAVGARGAVDGLVVLFLNGGLPLGECQTGAK